MTKLRVDFFSISLDGYGAGPNQSFDTPLGIGGESLHDWFVVTRSFHQVAGQDGGRYTDVLQERGGHVAAR